MMRFSAWIFVPPLLAITVAMAQPEGIPGSGDAPCAEVPDSSAMRAGMGFPDAEGFYPLFNGTDLTGWWQNCSTRHSHESREGAIFRVNPGERALYSAQRFDSIGGVLMTEKTFDHCELRFETWPDFGNDAGIMNRSPAIGKCYMTSLPYMRGGMFGGVWGEGGASRFFYAFMFLRAEEQISIGTSDISQFRKLWTPTTKALDPLTFGCAVTGCVEKDWPRLWDPVGWNEMKIRFHGGKQEPESVFVSTWFRKAGAKTWVPLFVDTAAGFAGPAGHIGITVRGGKGRFTGQNGTWYRNIRLQPLDYLGKPLDPSTVRGRGGRSRPKLQALRSRRIGIEFIPPASDHSGAPGVDAAGKRLEREKTTGPLPGGSNER